jgi:hypothetical protein
LAEFATTLAGRPASCCQACRRAAGRLASRRRAAAIRLLIALHPQEWTGLLALVAGSRQPPATRRRQSPATRRREVA